MEIGCNDCPCSSASRRIISTAVRGRDINAIYAERALQSIEGRRGEQGIYVKLRVGSKRTQLCLSIALCDEDNIEALARRTVVDDFRGSDDGAVTNSHGLLPSGRERL